MPNYKSKNPIKLIVELYKFPHVVKYKRPILVGTALGNQTKTTPTHHCLLFIYL